MTARPYWYLVVALILTFYAAWPANAGSLTISPVKNVLETDGGVTTARLRNRAPGTMLVQVETYEWAEDVELAHKTRAIIAVPPVFELQPNAEQILRVSLREPLLSDTERVFRLTLTEVPKDTSLTTGLSFAVRLNLPVFVTPRGATPQPVVALEATDQGSAAVTISNRGRAHAKVSDLRVNGRLLAEGASYVLAGESKSWPLGKSLSELPEVIEVRAETNHGPIVAQVRPGSG